MLENAIHPFTPSDDNFHEYDDHPWFTETSWYSFNVPERNLGAWLHGSVRPNLGICTFQVFVWDGSANKPWELPYYFVQTSQPLPKERDLRNFSFPHGWSVEMLEPLMRYRLQYEDRDLISLDLLFEGMTEPHPFEAGVPPFDKSHHWDQPGRVYGELVLHGEKIPVDCFSVRDRSWGPRVDHRGGRIGYPFGTASETDAFCLFCRPQELNADGSEKITNGYLIQDGIRQQIESGKRFVERDKQNGWITRQVIECKDAAGRILEAEGKSLSRMFDPKTRGMTVNSFVEWKFNGVVGCGEDQDVWRNDLWSKAARQGF